MLQDNGMLKRKIEKKIEYWIEHRELKKAFMIEGARQVGKTFSVRSVLERMGVNYVEVNLFTDKDFTAAIERINSVDDLVSYISVLKNITPEKGKTVIFFDEIQEGKELITKIKFLVDEGSFRYILSGSLLGIAMRNISSVPVGYLMKERMYPLDFEEFLQIYSFTDEIKSLLKSSFDNLSPVPEYIHSEIMKRYYYYLVVGGMPEAVMSFMDRHDLNEVGLIQEGIIDQYRDDFSKYEEENRKLFLRSIYDRIPGELMNPNKRFNYASVRKGLSSERSFDSFMWLTYAGAALPVYNVVSPSMPLLLNEKNNLFKLFLSDVGLLSYMLGEETRRAMVLRNEDVNYGAVFENAVAMELFCHGFQVYYYNSKKHGEVDFVVEYKGKVLPIEVKSGKTYQRHSALNNLLEMKEQYGIEDSVVLSSSNVKRENGITYLPVYMLMFLQREEHDLPIVNPGPLTLS